MTTTTSADMAHLVVRRGPDRYTFSRTASNSSGPAGRGLSAVNCAAAAAIGQAAPGRARIAQPCRDAEGIAQGLDGGRDGVGRPAAIQAERGRRIAKPAVGICGVEA